MGQQYTATLDANNEVLGPFYVAERAVITRTITDTITLTPRIYNQGSAVSLTAEAATASGAWLVNGPATYDVIASGVSGGSAVVTADT
jgi:hypothetical protein